MYKVFAILMLIALIGVGAALYSRPHLLSWFIMTDDMPLVTFNEQTPLRVTVLTEQAELVRGLSGRESLGPTEGMLFVFSKDDYHGIWMKDMLFPIDIVWVNRDGVIVDIAQSVRPDTYPTVFEPSVPARFVIETNAYFTDSFGIRKGDTVQLPKEATEGLKN